MKQELKQKWVEALRGGKYMQGFGTLRDTVNGGFCCLGVLADATHPDGWLKDRHRISFSGSVPEFGLTGQQVDIFVDMNDDKRLSFAEIADYIEGAL